jgi:hypothetical protein
MNKLLLTILISVNIGIFIVAFLLAPLNATPNYWLSTGWITFLFSLNWLASASIVGNSLSEKSNLENTILGALPAVNIVVFFYSVFSILFLLLTTWLELVSWNLQLALQICTATLFFVWVILLLISARGARIAESEFITKSQLLEEISRLRRQSTDPNFSTEFNNIVSYINYEMPHPSKLPAPALSDYYDKLRCYTHVDEIELDQLLSRLKSI